MQHIISIFNQDFCSCSSFLEFANCRHYVGACIAFDYVDETDKEFCYAKGRGRPKGAKGALTL
jgi:hypothetical protein